MSDGRSSGSPQYEYSLAQLTRCGFRVSKHFLFCLIWDYLKFAQIQKNVRISLFCLLFQKIWKFFEFNSEARDPCLIW
jgi:hypothetical protein